LEFSHDSLKTLRNLAFDRVAEGARGHGYEQLDQLTVEVLMGVR
jgi:xylose isomerase